MVTLIVIKRSDILRDLLTVTHNVCRGPVYSILLSRLSTFLTLCALYNEKNFSYLEMKNMLITEEVHSSHSIYNLHVHVLLNEHHVVKPMVCLRSTQNSTGSTADKQYHSYI